MLMNAIAPEDAEWARLAAKEGRGVDYIAAVLGVKPKKIAAIVSKPKSPEVNGRYAWRAAEVDTSSARAKAEALFAHDEPADVVPEPEPAIAQPQRRTEDKYLRRRRFLLTVRYARHWDLIWFLVGQGMSNRTLARHFGRDCVRWARGYLFWEDMIW
jgi:hypothetical protein